MWILSSPSLSSVRRLDSIWTSATARPSKTSRQRLGGEVDVAAMRSFETPKRWPPRRIRACTCFVLMRAKRVPSAPKKRWQAAAKNGGWEQLPSYSRSDLYQRPVSVRSTVVLPPTASLERFSVLPNSENQPPRSEYRSCTDCSFHLFDPLPCFIMSPSRCTTSYGEAVTILGCRLAKGMELGSV
ncbi:hypothetical protein BKA80DRAFT_278781 [Phyllosticta citrichinensis]